MEVMQLSGPADEQHSRGFLHKRGFFLYFLCSHLLPSYIERTFIYVYVSSLRDVCGMCTSLYLCTLISVTLLTSSIDHAVQCHTSSDFTNGGINEDSIMESNYSFEVLYLAPKNFSFGEHTNVLH